MPTDVIRCPKCATPADQDQVQEVMAEVGNVPLQGAKDCCFWGTLICQACAWSYEVRPVVCWHSWGCKE